MAHQINQLFQLGQLVYTASVQHLIEKETISNIDLFTILRRHASGDWGDLCEEDKQVNQSALADGDRLLSSYTINKTTLWIITEADRSVTTILLPEDY